MKPKMQLSEDVMVSPSFRLEMNAWMIDFFGYEEDDAPRQTPVPTPVAYDDVVPKATRPKPIKAKRKSRTQVQPDTETFAGLLEGLEDSFYTMQVPAISGSWLEKRNVNAIKKLGVYIPGELALPIVDNPVVPAGARQTAIASSYFVPKRYDSKDKMHQRFIFAIRAQKLPENVEKTQGIPYQFGACFEIDRTEKGESMKPHLFWSWCWMVIRPDGSIRIPHEMRRVVSVVKHRSAMSGYKGHKGSRTSSIPLKQWAIPSMAVAEGDRDQSGFEIYLKCAFKHLLVQWSERKSQWSVGVRKDGHRVTFGIAQEHTSAYFADRETVVNVDGKPKKIIDRKSVV